MTESIQQEEEYLDQPFKIKKDSITLDQWLDAEQEDKAGKSHHKQRNAETNSRKNR